MRLIARTACKVAARSHRRDSTFWRGCRVSVSVIAVALLGVSTASAHGIAGGARGLTAKIDGGVVEGVLRHGVISFKGIPFAVPPVGVLRWQPPHAVIPWKGARRAVSYGPDCMQIPVPGDAAPLGVNPAEDCLYVNVWRPRSADSRNLPVMVWIYGGGFVNGGSSPPEYDGSSFARDGIVLVSFNYRLGNFGFFAHPALTAEARRRGELVGDYALMDQIAALRWVQRNIGKFGGNPANVTIFGESAGGVSVNALLTTPLAAGLFQKAIIESGGGRPNLLPLRPLSGGTGSGEALGLALAEHFDIKVSGAGALLRLRRLSARKLVDGLNMMNMRSTSTYPGLILDGKLLLGAPTVLYAKGKGARVPLMIGANSMELGMTKVKTLAQFNAQFGPDASTVRKLYAVAPGMALGPFSFKARSIEAVAAEAGGDLDMAEPARQIARLLSARGQAVYEYRFSYVAQSERKSWSGAPHATEIPFVFDTLAARYGTRLASQDEATAQAMHAYWVAFAKTGKPDPRGEPAWPAYHAATDELMNFTERGPIAQKDPWKARLDLAQRINERNEHAGNAPGAN